jgi:Holliday junction resolvase-like predicted endonuclease
MVNVVKWDGRSEPFNRKKVAKTVIRLGATSESAERIVQQVEEKVYDGISTKEILDIISGSLKQHEPAIISRIDLKTALGEMKPTPDFEAYVRILLSADGYEVTPNRVIQGFCVTHEIDGIARRNGETIYLEVKNHSNLHRYTPFDVTLVAKAKWDDIQKGYEKGVNETSFDRVLIVCNTRLTQHAKKYAKCIGIDHIGWNTPRGEGIDAIITETNLYPVTILKTLSAKEHDRLSEAGIITLDQLLNKGLDKIRMKESRKKELIGEAERAQSI